MKEEEKSKMLLGIIELVEDTISLTKLAYENDLSGCWLADGGIGEHLEKLGRIYQQIDEEIITKRIN